MNNTTNSNAITLIELSFDEDVLEEIEDVIKARKEYKEGKTISYEQRRK